MKLAKNLERLGTETAFSVLAEAKKLEAQGKEMIHLGLGQPDFKTPQHIMDAAKKAIDDGHHGYVLANGITECRQAVSRKIKSLYKKNELKIFGKGMIDAYNKKIIVSNLGDHRIAMSSFILAILTGAKTKIKNFETVNTSSPSFLKIMKSLGAKFEIYR